MMAAPSPVEAGWLFGMREEVEHHEHPQMNVHDHHHFEESHVTNSSSSKLTSNANPSTQKKKRTQPDPGSEVIALSPKTLTTSSRFICDVCNKGFQREQNLQLHRRGHSLPWKLKLKSTNTNEVRKKVYVCPEPTCVHHNPSRALGDLTGIKKHFFRKHCEKKWECEKCSKRYAVQSDWKAHSKTCGTKEYRCDCGTLFSRRDSFMTHQAFCNAIAQGSLVNTMTNLSALKSQVLGHMSMVINGNDFGSFIPSSAFHQPSNVALSCSPTYHDQEEQEKLALDVMMKQKDDQSENTDHQQSFFYTTAREDYSENPNNVDYYNNSKMIRNDFSSTNLYGDHHQVDSVGGSSARVYVSQNAMSDHNISQCLYTSTNSVSLQNCNNDASSSSAYLSATALLQKATQVGSSWSNDTGTMGSSTTKNKDLDNNYTLLGTTSATCFSTLQNSNHIVHDGWMRSYNGGGVGSIIPISSTGELYSTSNGGVLVVPTGGGTGVCDVLLTRDFLGVGLNIVKPMISDGTVNNDNHMLRNDHQGNQMSSRTV